MTPADRAALAARLRDLALGPYDLLLADELERPRPRIGWRVHPGEVEAVLPPFGVVWVGNVRAASKHRDKWIAAGFDVDEVPRG